jgi:hypothetical protein
MSRTFILKYVVKLFLAFFHSNSLRPVCLCRRAHKDLNRASNNCMLQNKIDFTFIHVPVDVYHAAFILVSEYLCLYIIQLFSIIHLVCLQTIVVQHHGQAVR